MMLCWTCPDKASLLLPLGSCSPLYMPLLLLTDCACMLSCFSLTLSNPMDYSPPGSSVHGILQARILECAAMPSSRAIFWTQGLNPPLLRLLHWQVGSLLNHYLGSPCWIYLHLEPNVILDLLFFPISKKKKKKKRHVPQPGRTAEGIFILTQDYAELSFLSFFFFFLSCHFS